MKCNTAIRARLLVSFMLAAGSAPAADQWFDPGVSAGFTGGTAEWDLVTPAWANTSAGTNNPVTWGDGNNAWFTGPAGTATVNGATAGWLILANASGAANTKYVLPGTAPLTLNTGITTYASAAFPHAGQGGGGIGWIGADLALGADQDWHVANYTLTVTGRVTGAYTLGKCGYIGLTLSNAANSFAALVIRNGTVSAFGGGTVLGGGPVSIGSAISDSESLVNQIAPGLTVYGNGGGGTTVTTIGDLSCENNGTLTLTYSGTGTNILQAGTLNRNGNSTLSVQGSSKFGTQNQVTFTGGVATENGILPPWIVESSGAGPEFLTYTPNGISNAVYAGAFNPALSNQVVSRYTPTTLTAPQTVHAFRLYYTTFNMNGYDLTVGNGTHAGLSLANCIITNGPGLRFGTAEILVVPSATAAIGVPLEGSGPLTVFGKGGILSLSNSALYAGGPITVQSPATLQLWPMADVTLSNSLVAALKGTLQKNGPATLTLQNSTNLVAEGALLTVNGGSLILDNVLMTNKGSLAMAGTGVALILTNATQMPGQPTVSISGASNLLALSDSLLGSGTNINATSISGTRNRLSASRSRLSTSALNVGGTAFSNNTVTVLGPDASWNFNNGALSVGPNDGGANNNDMTVDGGGVPEGAVLTNIASVSVGAGGNSGGKSGNAMTLANGASLYAGSISVGSGNNSSLPSNNILRIGGGSAPCVVKTTGSISMGGSGAAPYGNSNRMTITNTLLWSVGCTVSGPNNTLLMEDGTVWDLAGGANSFGGGGISNTILADGASLINVGRLLFSGHTNTLTLCNGAKLIGTGSGNGNSFGSGTHGGTFTVGSGSLFVYVRSTDVGAGGGSGNAFVIDNATVSNGAFAALTIGAGRGNSLLLANGGRLYAAGGGVTIGSGGLNSSNNTLRIENGGQLLGVSTLTVGNTSSNNSALVSTGSVLEAASLTVGATIPGAGNTLANTGGVYQFTAAAPTITRGSNSVITLTDGTLSFRGVATANVKGNWTTTLTNITLTGANAFRLDTATNNNAVSQSYWFDTDRGNTNYAGLEMFNGGTAYTNGSVTIGTNGWLTFSNTQAILWGPVTNYGVMSVFDSTVTFKSNLVLAEGCTLVWSTRNATNAVTVLGSLSLPASLTVYAPIDIPKGETLTLFNAQGGITGSTAGWTVIPDYYRVNKNGTAITLTRKAAGSIIIVR